MGMRAQVQQRAGVHLNNGTRESSAAFLSVTWDSFSEGILSTVGTH